MYGHAKFGATILFNTWTSGVSYEAKSLASLLSVSTL